MKKKQVKKEKNGLGRKTIAKLEYYLQELSHRINTDADRINFVVALRRYENNTYDWLDDLGTKPKEELKDKIRLRLRKENIIF